MTQGSGPWGQGPRNGGASRDDFSRRELLAFSLGGTLFGWMPWFRPKRVGLAGAQFQILRTKHPRRHYLVIHGDETTAREVLLDHLESHRGIGYVIESRTRDVPIENGKIDPNRMFSRPGAHANLQQLNPKWTQEQMNDALDLLDDGREHLLRALFPSDKRVLIALHNNSEAYSVNNELDSSERGSVKQPDNPHAFFLCTDPNDYQILATSPYNVVLQQFVRGPDDGSLSRRAAARYQRYVNLEVRMGDAARQREMLEWAESNLP
ncbi:MAG TPA: hypothetical protein VKB88_18425 [Bryobacteraceae bacterium]|nr:hypothetical protein [Bryobacteraceae bacterium]